MSLRVFLRRLAWALLLIALVAFVASYQWNRQLVEHDETRPDPALAYANSLGGGPYSEAYFQHGEHSLHTISAGPERSQYVDANADSGAGSETELVLLLHGFPSYWLSMLGQMQALKSDYRVIAVDGLGVGRSSVASDIDAYRMQALCEQLLALVQAQGVSKVHLIGHDWGSVLAAGFAQRYPDSVSSLTAISALPMNLMLRLFQEGGEQSKASSYIELLKRMSPTLLWLLNVGERVVGGAYQPLVEQGHMDAEAKALFEDAVTDVHRLNAHIHWYRANVPAPEDIMAADFWPSASSRLTMPTLFVLGEDDATLAADAAEQLASISDDLTVLSLPGVGHWPHWQAREQVNAAIRSHLQSSR